MESVKLNDAIECASAEIISRDIKVGAFVNLPVLGRCRTYNCKRNSEATVLKELTEQQKKDRYDKHALVNIGDKISGENVTVYVQGVKSLKIQVINKSGRHKAQSTQTHNYTYASIALQFHNIRLVGVDTQEKLRC